ncbi:MAG: alcohol dehydrogenase catalytic domain-containing protein [Sphingomonadales bacterium]|nr:alcohol dehydrogenase catalytic domain-containing protein [Sphingomonadales bacterium]
MKAAIYPGHGQPIRIDTLPDPEPGPGDLVIKVDRCGICGTDLTMTKGGMWDFGQNVQFGHEYAGTVVATGPGTEGWSAGDRVAVLPSISCGECAACRSHGNAVLCQSGPGSAMIGFAEYARIPATVATRLPTVLSLADGALIEPLAVSLYGVKLAQIQPGDPVLVLGGGTVALYAIYWARRLGAGRIVAMSRSPRRKDLSLAMGADQFIAYSNSEIPEVIDALGGVPPKFVFEAVGAEGMLQKAVMHVAQFGKVVSLGFCTAPDPLIPAIASYKCAAMQFAVGYSMKEFLYIADYLDRGHADPKAIVTRNEPLSALPAMFDLLRGSNEETKIHIHCGSAA